MVERISQSPPDGEGNVRSAEVEEWIWRVQEIEKGIDQLLPSDALRVCFAIREASPPWKTKPFDRWPKGQLLFYSKGTVQAVKDGNGCCGIRLHASKHAAYTWDSGKMVSAQKPETLRNVQAELYGFYFLDRPPRLNRSSGLRLETGHATLEDAMRKALATAPLGITERMGMFPAYCDWGTLLLWFAAENAEGFHPLVDLSVFRPTSHAFDKKWKNFMPDGTFLVLDPDVRTASKMAIARLIREASCIIGQGGTHDPKAIQTRRTRRPGNPPLTPERREACRAYRKKYLTVFLPNWERAHRGSKRGVRSAFAKANGKTVHDSNLMIRSGAQR